MSTYQAVIERIQTLCPTYYKLDNESDRHAGFFDGKESHFRLIMVSQAFAQKRLVARHQMIYDLTKTLMIANGGTIHALSIYAYTPDEWQTADPPDSPNCAGKNT